MGPCLVMAQAAFHPPGARLGCPALFACPPFLSVLPSILILTPLSSAPPF